MNPFTIAFCGGGSVGHVAPSVAVARAVMRLNPDVRPVFYCARREDETAFLTHESMPYRCLPAAKFPRGISAGWLSFPFVFPYSVAAAFVELWRTKPAVIFSKGGYISAPVCIAGKLLGIPIVLHESDATGGMSNRLISYFAKTVCLGFPASIGLDTVVTGNPVRPDVLKGDRNTGRRITGFSGDRLVILVIGGSQGSAALNEAVETHFEALISMANVVHITGTGKGGGRADPRYWARPFVTEELKHLYALADVVVSRAGAGTLSELSALGKATIAVPLRGIAQDHQHENAKRLEAAGAVRVLQQESLADLPAVLRTLLEAPAARAALGVHLRAFFPADAATAIAKVVLDAAAPRA